MLIEVIAWAYHALYTAGMDLRQLELFVRIARLGGFRRAADDLGISQAAVSQQMKLLEAEARVSLFERAHRPVTLTEAGETLLERAELILREVRSTREELQAFAGLERRHVTVGTIPAHGAPWTARLLGAFHRQHPGVQLGVAEHTSGVLLDLLLDRGIDVACMNVPADGWQPPPGVCLAPIATFDLVLAVHPRHRLGGLPRVRLAELVGEPLILPPQSSISMIVEHAFRAHDLVPTIGFEISDQHTLLELAAEGLGLGVSTRTTVQAYPDLALWAVELADAPLRGQAVVAWSERGIRTKAVQAMVQHAQGWAQELPRLG
jgi:DNA-binding transcriptional LysR family regulator